MYSKNIKYVLTIAEEKSFSKAAKKLYLSQPALSATISKIEKEIGNRLFDRSTSPIQLSEAGEAYILTAKKMMTLEKDLNNYLMDLAELKTGKLSIGGTHFFVSCFLPSILSLYSEKHPGIEVEVFERNSLELEQLLLEGTIDLVVDCYPFNMELFSIINIFHETVLLAVPKKFPINDKLKKFQLSSDDIKNNVHLSSDCPTLNLNTFKNEPFLFLKQGNHMHDLAVKLCKNSEFDPKIKMNFDQLMTTYSMTVANLGVSFTTDIIVKYSNLASQPVFYKLDSPLTYRNSSIIYKKNKYLSKAAQEFIKVVEESI